jgi:tRNA-2-methylthio-N6-dimethylallyladenosine synthase
MKDYSKYFNLPSQKEAGKRSKNSSEIVRDEIVIPKELVSYAHGKKYYVHTFGCQANERDGELIAGILEKIGYTKASNMHEASLVLLNTCAVRENAEAKVFGTIGAVKNFKKTSPDVIFGICGCMVQEESVVKRIKEKYPHVDLIFGTHNIVHLPELLLAVMQNQRVIEVYSKEGEIYECIPSRRDNKYKAWINIMYGCDKFCTYCIVPYTRGKERSRLKEDIIQEVKEVIAEGYQEVTLLGQNVNAYGNDLNLGYTFADLLNEVARTNIPRVRFMTSHPWNFTTEMIDSIKNNPNIMPYIHLPLQSGDDEILRRMGRRYTSEEYRTLFTRMKEEIPGVCISTDIIVGFPNESEEQFRHTLEMVNYCKFDSAFTFIFSPRPGTPAANMEDTISNETKHKRFNALLELVNQYSLESNQKFLNKTVLVLVDGISKKNDNVLSGYSEENKVVNFKGPLSLIGKIVPVKITNVKSFSLEGELNG